MSSRILTLLLVLMTMVYTGCNKENTTVANHPETMAARDKTAGPKFVPAPPDQLISGKYLVSGTSSFNPGPCDPYDSPFYDSIYGTVTISASGDSIINFTVTDSNASIPNSYGAGNCTLDTGTALGIGKNYFIFINMSGAIFFPKNNTDSIYINQGSGNTGGGDYQLTLSGTKIK